MRGLIIKDFLNLKKQILPMIMFLTVYFFIAIVSKNSSFFTGVVMIFCAMLPVTALSIDDRANFDKYALTMPVSRSTLVVSRYVLALILLSIGSILSLLISAFIGNFSFQESLFSIIITMLIGSLMVSISFPFIFKFGIEKGRFIVIGIVMLIGFFGSFLFMQIGKGKVLMNMDKGGFSLGPNIDSFLNSHLPFFIMLCTCILLFLLSLTVSISIYRKKDF